MKDRKPQDYEALRMWNDMDGLHELMRQWIDVRSQEGFAKEKLRIACSSNKLNRADSMFSERDFLALSQNTARIDRQIMIKMADIVADKGLVAADMVFKQALAFTELDIGVHNEKALKSLQVHLNGASEPGFVSMARSASLVSNGLKSGGHKKDSNKVPPQMDMLLKGVAKYMEKCPAQDSLDISTRLSSVLNGHKGSFDLCSSTAASMNAVCAVLSAKEVAAEGEGKKLYKNALARSRMSFLSMANQALEGLPKGEDSVENVSKREAFMRVLINQAKLIEGNAETLLVEKAACSLPVEEVKSLRRRTSPEGFGQRIRDALKPAAQKQNVARRFFGAVRKLPNLGKVQPTPA